MNRVGEAWDQAEVSCLRQLLNFGLSVEEAARVLQRNVLGLLYKMWREEIKLEGSLEFISLRECEEVRHSPYTTIKEVCRDAFKDDSDAAQEKVLRYLVTIGTFHKQWVEERKKLWTPDAIRDLEQYIKNSFTLSEMARLLDKSEFTILSKIWEVDLVFRNAPCPSLSYKQVVAIKASTCTNIASIANAVFGSSDEEFQHKLLCYLLRQGHTSKSWVERNKRPAPPPAMRPPSRTSVLMGIDMQVDGPFFYTIDTETVGVPPLITQRAKCKEFSLKENFKEFVQQQSLKLSVPPTWVENKLGELLSSKEPTLEPQYPVIKSSLENNLNLLVSRKAKSFNLDESQIRSIIKELLN